MDTELLVEPLPLLGVCNLCLGEGSVRSMLLPHNYNGRDEMYYEMLIKCFSIDIKIFDLGDLKCLICDNCVLRLRDSVNFREQIEESLTVLERRSKSFTGVKDELHDFDMHLENDDNSIDDPDYICDEDDPDKEANIPIIDFEVKAQELIVKSICRKVGVKNGKRKGATNISRTRRILKLTPKDLKMNDNSTDDPDYMCDEDDDDKEANIPLIDFAFKSEQLITDSVCKKEDEKNERRNSSSNLSKSRRIMKLQSKEMDIDEIEHMLKSGLFPFKMHNNRSFSCAVCALKTRNLVEIKTHTAIHSKESLHKAFQNMVLSKTQRFYKTTNKLRCKICTADISNFEELNSHIENCTRIKFRTGKRSSNSGTLPFKLEKDQLDCPICKKNFLNFVSLNTHMNIHYPNHICENCGKAFASTARLRGHIRTHEVGEFPCKYCDAVFDRITKRENHVSKEHKAGVRYACKRCNISLTSFYAKQKHLAEVHNEELKRYKCKACPQSYITPGHLSSHIRRDHLKERNHKCEKCDLAFYTRNALKMHMIKHDGEKIHACNICQKSYQRKKTLREHMRIHTNDKRFACPVCDKAFTQKCTLKGHLKVHEKKVELDDNIVHHI